MNDKEMILASIGSGSCYLPDIAEMLIERKAVMRVKEWRLMDVDGQRLQSTGKYVQKMFAGANMSTKIIMTEDLKTAVTDCDFALCTIRPGKSDARILDETIPFKYYLIGQETTAPGGTIMGFKTIPAMLAIAEALERYSNIKYAGLCNGPTVIRAAMEVIYGAKDPNELFVEVIGLNHLIWCKVFYKGEDVTNEAFDKLVDWAAVNVPPLRTEFVEPELQRFIGWIPMGPYLKFYYDYKGSLADLRDSSVYWPAVLEKISKNIGNVLDGIEIPEHATRSEIVKMVEERTFELYDKLDDRAYALAANTRGGKDYGKAGITLINAIWNNTNEVFSPDVASMGTIQGLDPACVCTTTALVNAAGIHPIAFPKLPGHMMSKILAAKEYEKLAVEAAVTGSYHTALEALVANPLITSYYDAKGALDELLVAEKEYLPQFKEAIEALERGEAPYISKGEM